MLATTASHTVATTASQYIICSASYKGDSNVQAWLCCARKTPSLPQKVLNWRVLRNENSGYCMEVAMSEIRNEVPIQWHHNHRAKQYLIGHAPAKGLNINAATRSHITPGDLAESVLYCLPCTSCNMTRSNRAASGCYMINHFEGHSRQWCHL